MLLSQVITHEDSLDNEFDLKIQALFGNILKGKTIPDFIITDKNGIIMSRNELLSKVTFINFWFEAYAPCIAEFQALQKFYVTNKSRKEFQFISITFEPDSTIERVRKALPTQFIIYLWIVVNK